jgi:hypothetical protein
MLHAQIRVDLLQRAPEVAVEVLESGLQRAFVRGHAPLGPLQLPATPAPLGAEACAVVAAVEGDWEHTATLP